MAKKTQNFNQFLIKTRLSACLIVAMALFFFACEKQETPLETKPIYTVTFNSKGGSEINAVKVKHGDTVTLPDNPVKNNAVFGGWYARSKVRAIPFSSSTAITADLTLYAEWKVFTLSSSSFTDGGEISKKYASPYYYNNGCIRSYKRKVGYLNVSPQLSWKNAPPETTSFFITMENTSTRDFLHWVIYDIPAHKTSLKENESLLLEELIEYKELVKYMGPLTYEGKAYTYQITIFALDLPLNSFSIFYYFSIPKTKAELKKKFKAHILATAFITGKFISEPVD